MSQVRLSTDRERSLPFHGELGLGTGVAVTGVFLGHHVLELHRRGFYKNNARLELLGPDDAQCLREVKTPLELTVTVEIINKNGSYEILNINFPTFFILTDQKKFFPDCFRLENDQTFFHTFPDSVGILNTIRNIAM